MNREDIEKHLRLRQSDVSALSDDEIRRLIHELQVHQIELDAQNEELRVKERELSEARDYLAQLFDAAPIAYVTTDPRGLLCEVNLAAQQLLGCAPSECIGKPLWKFVVRDDRDKLYLHRRQLESYPAATCELRLERYDGEVFDIRMTSRPRGDQVLVALIDETDQRRAEAELRALAEQLEERVAERTAEAERRARDLAASQNALRTRETELRQAQKMQAIGRLASGVAHEFNNLLMGIIGTAEMCLDIAAPDSELQKLLERLRDSAAGGAELSQQLMVFGRQGDEDGVAFLDETLGSHEKLLRKTLGDDVEFRVLLGAPGAQVPCSAVRLAQILMNLTMNARQAMPGGGTLILQTQVLALGRAGTDSLANLPPGNYAVLQVRDTGTGMSEETRTRAFEPFFTTKAVGEGAGIGLSTVYGIATRAGGRVLIDSELGFGTVVTVILPVVVGRVSRRPSPIPPASTDLVGKTVLLSKTIRSCARRCATTSRPPAWS